MHLIVHPHFGAGPFSFGSARKVNREIVGSDPLTKVSEPENDFFPSDGLILGYDEKDALEFVEIIRPSKADLEEIKFFEIDLLSCLDRLKKNGLVSKFDDGGYNFPSIGLALYCPNGHLESVALYRDGYYDE